MKQTGYGIYLPGWEYVPDGEPHVFGERLYLFGSHDRFGGEAYCQNDYVCWSAPVTEPWKWVYEGVIYKKTQDPDNSSGKLAMWAPDVAKGSDGRYYLYYCLADYPKIGVAVCDTPSGKYQFYNYVHDSDGNILGKRQGDSLPFDPAVFTDVDGRIHLYSGQAPRERSISQQIQQKTQPKTQTCEPENPNGKKGRKYVWHMELEPDMCTLKSEPAPLLPNISNSAGTGFEGHEFFEASSMRRFDSKYYFIYSSVRSHELCYAFSDYPDRGFCYGGILISNGDIGMREKKSENGKRFGLSECLQVQNAGNYIGNTHGSIEKIGEDYYVFYHRHTNRNKHTRQGAVQRIIKNADGSFEMAEMTSEGFYRILPGRGDYEARIACNLWSKEGCTLSDEKEQNQLHPAFTQDEPDGQSGIQYIGNLRDGATAGFKYFEPDQADGIRVTVRGMGSGKIIIRTEETGSKIAEIPVYPTESWTMFKGRIKKKKLVRKTGGTALFFTFAGSGAIDFLAFSFEN